jgi:hypothetical protein
MDGSHASSPKPAVRIDSALQIALSSLLRCASDKKKAKELSAVKTCCEAHIAKFGVESSSNVTELQSLSGVATDSADIVYKQWLGEEADLKACNIFEPFKMALDTKIPQMTECAIENLHQLLILGILRGGHPYQPASPLFGEGGATTGAAALVSSVLVESVSSSGCIADCKIQIQAVRLLEAFAVVEASRVDGGSLLLCVRACCNVFLGSSSQSNQAYAREALNRIVACVMKRMEGPVAAAAAAAAPAAAAAGPAADAAAGGGGGSSKDGLATAAAGPSPDGRGRDSDPPAASGRWRPLFDHVIHRHS